MDEFDVEELSLYDELNIFINNDFPLPLSKEEFARHFELFKKGDLKSKDILVRHNLKLVSKRIYSKFKNINCEKRELFAIGLVGLVKAVNSFDIERGNAFSVFAISCIDHEILSFLRGKKKYKDVVSLDEVVYIDSYDVEITRLDMLEDEDSVFLEFVEDSQKDFEVRKAVDKLEGRDLDIIKMYFGFYDDICYSGREIAEKYKISKQAISLIIRRNLEFLKQELENNVKLREEIYDRDITKVKKRGGSSNGVG